jgi:two-component system, cell cycle sensor histidine kinase and response regulator CckA
MNTARPFPWSDPSSTERAETEFHSIFRHAPVAAASCDAEGVIVARNAAFEALDPELSSRKSLRLYDLVSPQDRDATESLLCELLDSTRDTFHLAGRNRASGPAVTNWTAWRLARSGDEPAHALVIAESLDAAGGETLLQDRRWEAVGRMAGGITHDFSNILTGVTLYCDLLLSSLDARDRRRRYAAEIRSAVMQATVLVGQLLAFAGPQAPHADALCLNQTAHGMRDLLTRLVTESIVLEFHLDPDLGLVKMNQTQAQQILLNLVLNARDAMPGGGRIVVETSNCKFQTTAGSMLPQQGTTAFPCVLLVIGDNGRGMDTKTRQRLFEPFFTTKSAGKGTGLGLTTVRSIVTENRGLIHVGSKSGSGTRVMILLPRESQSSDTGLLGPSFIESAKSSSDPSLTPFRQDKKESLL